MGVRVPFKSFLLLLVMSSPKALLGPNVCLAGVAMACNKSRSVKQKLKQPGAGCAYLRRIFVKKRTS
jgi:hypothetical protein